MIKYIQKLINAVFNLKNNMDEINPDIVEADIIPENPETVETPNVPEIPTDTPVEPVPVAEEVTG